MRFILFFYGIVVFILLGLILGDYILSCMLNRNVTEKECEEQIAFLQKKLDEFSRKSESGWKDTDNEVELYLDALDTWKKKLKKIQKRKLKKQKNANKQ